VIDDSDGGSLSRIERSVCALVGIAAAGAGGVAVFVDGSNIGGVPLLIGVGALFGYLAVSGQRLSQVKVGGNEASFIGRILRDPSMSDAAKAEVAERLDDVALPAGTQRAVDEVRRAQMLAEEYRLAVTAAVERVAGGDIAARAELGRPPQDWDLLLRTDGGQAIGIEIKRRSRPVPATELTELLQLAATYSSTELGLIVINQPLAGGVRYDGDGKLWLSVSWSSPADDGQLAAAIQELLKKSGR
jgi:hypothetical protein